MNVAITLIISAVIIGLFIKSLLSQRNFKGEIVSLGILGTFIGIALGLFYFDVNDIQKSVPYLLDGLKTAFITSGVGILFSIVLSIIKPPKNKKDDTLEALQIVVSEFNNNLTKQFGDNFNQLNDAVLKMIKWQENYKSQIKQNEEALGAVVEKIKEVELIKENEQKIIQEVMNNLKDTTKEVKISLEETTDVVKEQLELLLREANRRL